MSGNVEPFSEREQKYMLRNRNKTSGIAGSYQDLADDLNKLFPEGHGDGPERTRDGVAGWLRSWFENTREAQIVFPNGLIDRCGQYGIDPVDIQFCCIKALQFELQQRMERKEPSPIKVKEPATSGLAGKLNLKKGQPARSG